jgi:hypothetical protein
MIAMFLSNAKKVSTLATRGIDLLLYCYDQNQSSKISSVKLRFNLKNKSKISLLPANTAKLCFSLFSDFR